MPVKKAEFHRFYKKHIDRVYRFVLFRVNRNVEVAEDLTSEIFLKALKAFSHYDPKKSETAWIMTIARNHLYNHYRDTKQTTDIDDIAFALVGEDGEATMQAIESELVVHEALEQMQEKDKQLIQMKYLEGFGYKDIAAVLGKSAGAVRVETHRAMKKLKSIMTTLYESGKKHIA